MLAHAISAASTDRPPPGSINRSHTTESPSSYSIRTPAKVFRTGAFAPQTTTHQGLNGIRRARQHKARRTVLSSAAATDAEPIAFARTDAAEAEEEDFYSILGVVSICMTSLPTLSVCICSCLSCVYMQPFNADDGQIKKAYYAIMRECHPDLSQDDESLEFSTVINEIYEVPMNAAVLAGHTYQNTEQRRCLCRL